MRNVEASIMAAQKIKGAAQSLLNIWKKQGVLEFESLELESRTKTKIFLNRAALANGNISSEIGAPRTSERFYRHSVWNLSQPPVDPPDIAELNRLADILDMWAREDLAR